MLGSLRCSKAANSNVVSARMAEFEALQKGKANACAAEVIFRYLKHLVGEHRTALQTVAERVSGRVPQTVTQTGPNPTQGEPKPTVVRCAGSRS